MQPAPDTQCKCEIHITCAKAHRSANMKCKTSVRERASAKLKLSPPHPWYYTGAGTECQEKAYAGLCVNLGRFAYNFRLLRGFDTKCRHFASRPRELASVLL